jgi:hypothetical protein
MSEDIRKMIDKVKKFKQFVNENKGNEIQIADGFENRPYSKSFEEQFNNGEIWFQSSGKYNQIFCLKINKGFIGEVDAMWTLFYKGTYFKPVIDKKNNLMIENDGFKNVKELFDWLNPILNEYKETFEWNVFA